MSRPIGGEGVTGATNERPLLRALPVETSPAHGVGVTALGGGHGLAAGLVAIREYAHRITAVVSVADDGGSSGRLRQLLGIPPPGDIRRCLGALSEPGSTWGRAFEHRFEDGELAGHPLGNLVIAGLTAATGDFQSALDEAGFLLHAVGRVLAATTVPVTLRARTEGGAIEGQAAVARTPAIRTISLHPADPPVHPDVTTAIMEADQVVLGPGSLYTSVLATATVPAIGAALALTRAQLVYVCNLDHQEAETAQLDVGDHVEALLEHGVEPDVVLCDTSAMSLGHLDKMAHEYDFSYQVADLRLGGARSHDPAKLARALSGLIG
ncbi:MAG: gluconeogenesis factor YvcK family protein [Acidimicrobiales bacterium]